jgi:hypothetical protein
VPIDAEDALHAGEHTLTLSGQSQDTVPRNMAGLYLAITGQLSKWREFHINKRAQFFFGRASKPHTNAYNTAESSPYGHIHAF